LSYGHQQSLDFSFSRADCKGKAPELARRTLYLEG